MKGWCRDYDWSPPGIPAKRAATPRVIRVSPADDTHPTEHDTGASNPAQFDISS
jgi:hypothetical protein